LGYIDSIIASDPRQWNKADSLSAMAWKKESNYSFSLTVMPELLELMSKDYTMLNKFPEYYAP